MQPSESAVFVSVNAADNKQRDPKNMNTIKIDIDP